MPNAVFDGVEALRTGKPPTLLAREVGRQAGLITSLAFSPANRDVLLATTMNATALL